MSYGYNDFSRIMNKKCLVSDLHTLKPARLLWIDDDDDVEDDVDNDDTNNMWDVM
jgi:hypothetical protein